MQYRLELPLVLESPCPCPFPSKIGSQNACEVPLEPNSIVIATQARFAARPQLLGTMDALLGKEAPGSSDAALGAA